MNFNLEMIPPFEKRRARGDFLTHAHKKIPLDPPFSKGEAECGYTDSHASVMPAKAGIQVGSLLASQRNLDSRVRGNDDGGLIRRLTWFAVFLSMLAIPHSLSAQAKPLKEVRVPYALGGSTGFFWVAQRSGSVPFAVPFP